MSHEVFFAKGCGLFDECLFVSFQCVLLVRLFTTCILLPFQLLILVIFVLTPEVGYQSVVVCGEHTI